MSAMHSPLPSLSGYIRRAETRVGYAGPGGSVRTAGAFSFLVCLARVAQPLLQVCLRFRHTEAFVGGEQLYARAGAEALACVLQALARGGTGELVGLGQQHVHGARPAPGAAA